MKAGVTFLDPDALAHHFSGMDMSVRCLPQVHNQSLGRVRDVQMGEGERAEQARHAPPQL